MAVSYPAWGIDAGGPNAGIVHQDRLYLAGSSIVPDLLGASRTGVWTDFRLGVRPDPDNEGSFLPVNDPDPASVTGFVATEADGFWRQQTTARGNGFHALLQQEGLFVFGDLGESVVPAGVLTGSTIEIRENSWYGSDRGRTPVIAGGLVIFLQSQGEDIRAIAWTESERKYLAPSLLSKAGNVFRRARDMTFRQSSGRDPDRVYVIDTEGALAVLALTIAGEWAWSRWTLPGGRVVAGTASLGNLAFVVERESMDSLGVVTQTLALETALADDAEWADVQVEAVVESPGVVPAAVVEFLAGAADRVCHNGAGNRFRLNAARDGLEDASVPGVTVSLAQGTRLVCGREVSYLFETLPFVEISETGVQRSTRRVRMLEAALDLVLPEGATDEQAADAAERMRLEIIATRSGQARNRDRGPPRRVLRDTPEIVRCRYAGVNGWRDRIALRFRSNRPVQVAGLSYIAVS